jgi:imidazolonepropionase-like amidohydrolase
MTPADALAAGSRNGALACRKSGELGVIEEGKLAELVVLDADRLRTSTTSAKSGR